MEYKTAPNEALHWKIASVIFRTAEAVNGVGAQWMENHNSKTTTERRRRKTRAENCVTSLSHNLLTKKPTRSDVSILCCSCVRVHVACDLNDWICENFLWIFFYIIRSSEHTRCSASFFCSSASVTTEMATNIASLMISLGVLDAIRKQQKKNETSKNVKLLKNDGNICCSNWVGKTRRAKTNGSDMPFGVGWEHQRECFCVKNSLLVSVHNLFISEGEGSIFFPPLRRGKIYVNVRGTASERQTINFSPSPWNEIFLHLFVCVREEGESLTRKVEKETTELNEGILWPKSDS